MPGGTPPSGSGTGPAEDEPLVITHAHPTLHLEEEALARLIRRVVAAEGAELRALGVVLADRATVLNLNRTYLQHDHATDVLSFSFAESDEQGVVDGEVYVDLETAAERHDEFGATFEQEARRYVVHGLLHLLGYDDATAEGRVEMRTLEDRYLALD